MRHKLYLDGRVESASDFWGEAKESYETETLISGLYGGRKIDKYGDGREFQNVYSMESRMGGEKVLTWVGTLDHTAKTYSHNHGYYTPHRTGRKLMKYAESIGYTNR